MIEFIPVTFASLFFSLSGILHGRVLVTILGKGIAANAIGVIAVAVGQIQDGDKSEGLLKFRSSLYRATVSREHPNLGTHTLIVLVSVLIPFLLVGILYMQKIKNPTNKPL